MDNSTIRDECNNIGIGARSVYIDCKKRAPQVQVIKPIHQYVTTVTTPAPTTVQEVRTLTFSDSIETVTTDVVSDPPPTTMLQMTQVVSDPPAYTTKSEMHVVHVVAAPTEEAHGVLQGNVREREETLVVYPRPTCSVDCTDNDD